MHTHVYICTHICMHSTLCTHTLSSIYRKSIGNISKLDRTSIDHLPEIYRTRRIRASKSIGWLNESIQVSGIARIVYCISVICRTSIGHISIGYRTSIEHLSTIHRSYTGVHSSEPLRVFLPRLESQIDINLPIIWITWVRDSHAPDSMLVAPVSCMWSQCPISYGIAFICLSDCQ